MTKTLFRGGLVVSADGRTRSDLLVEKGRVVMLGLNLEAGDAEIVNCSGKYVLPGGVDVHTHLDAPIMGTFTADDFDTGTRAAAAGGTTMLVDFAMQTKGQALQETVDAWHSKAQDKARIDYAFHIAVTDLYDGALSDLRTVVGEGVTSFKIFMAYKGLMMLDDGEIFQILREAGSCGARVAVHAENGDVIDVIAEELISQGKTGPRYHEIARPPATEVEAVRRAIAISRIADAPIYFVHLSTEGAIQAVAEARAHDWPVSAETCTHYLTLGPELYETEGFEPAKAVLTPPLRGEKHRSALWRGLRNGSLGVVSSDHCPFCFEQKKMGKSDFRQIPNGGAGIEHRMILMYSEGVAKGRISLEQYVDLTSTTPAKAFGMFPRKGNLEIGADADILVLNPEGHTRITAESHEMNMDYNLWEGWDVQGKIEQVYSSGELVGRDGKYVGARKGHYIARATV